MLHSGGVDTVSFPESAQTSRLQLRRWRDSDREHFVRIWADPEVWRALKDECPFDPAFADERFEHHLRHWREHGFGLWAAELRTSGEVAGWVGAAHPTHVPELAEEVEIGWALRHPFWRQGLAAEGAKAAVDAAFGCLEIERVVSVIHPTNDRSISVARRLGMHEAGSSHQTSGGDRVDLWSLPREAWANRPC
jgi:RimJ/RimL family protein N-acetyltransferase